MENKLYVSEIYSCLQGEGYNLGKPSILIRLQQCNLRCNWCDSSFTHEFEKDKEVAISDIITKIKEYLPIKHLIISGGEPTLQDFSSLAQILLQDNYTIEVETNGTRFPSSFFPGFTSDLFNQIQWNISPKGKNSGAKFVTSVLKQWANASRQNSHIFYKFVVTQNNAAEDLNEIVTLQTKLGMDHAKIFLMPEGVSKESQLSASWLHDLCIKYDFRYTPRLHVILFGNKKGV